MCLLFSWVVVHGSYSSCKMQRSMVIFTSNTDPLAWFGLACFMLACPMFAWNRPACTCKSLTPYCTLLSDGWYYASKWLMRSIITLWTTSPISSKFPLCEDQRHHAHCFVELFLLLLPCGSLPLLLLDKEGGLQLYTPFFFHLCFFLHLCFLGIYLVQSKAKDVKENSQETKSLNLEWYAIFIDQFELKSNHSLQFLVINATLPVYFQIDAP